MRAGNYGLTTSVRGPTIGGGSLVSQGQDQLRSASAMLSDAAAQETQRNITNQQMERDRKSGNAQLGATVGALAGAKFGAALGPWGMLAGGVLGGIAGGLF